MTTRSPRSTGGTVRSSPERAGPALPARAPARVRAFGAALQQWLGRPLTSLHLVLAVFGLLTALGLVMVLSASSVNAYAADGSSYGVFFRQVAFAALGAVLFWIGVRVPPRHWRAASPWLLTGCLLLLVLVLVPGLGAEVNGSRSWFRIAGSRCSPRRSRRSRWRCGGRTCWSVTVPRLRAGGRRSRRSSRWRR